MKSILPALNRWMPALMALFLLVMLIQAIVALHVTWAGIQRVLVRADPAYPVLVAVLLMLALGGLLYDRRTDRLLRLGIRRRKGFLMDVLARLTNRAALEDMLAREQRETVIDAEELAASLRARVIGQDRVCEDVAQQLRRRMALQVRGKPVGVFLLAGPPGTGKTYLAKQIARQTQRPLLHFDMAQMTSIASESQMFGMSKGYVGSDSYGRLTGGLKEKPDAVVLLDEIEKAHPDMLKKFLTAWNDGHVTEASNSEQISTLARDLHPDLQHRNRGTVGHRRTVWRTIPTASAANRSRPCARPASPPRSSTVSTASSCSTRLKDWIWPVSRPSRSRR